MGRVVKAGQRDLRRHGVEALDWREPVDGRAPRLGTREYIGTGVSRKGAFTKKDPLRTGKVWTRWHVAGLAFWAAWTGGWLALAKWRVDRTG